MGHDEDFTRFAGNRWSMLVRSAVLLVELALITAGCAAWPAQETEPPIAGEPMPGSFYLVSIPQFAPLRLMSGGSTATPCRWPSFTST